ncbi:hypothetical protein O181_053217 [Austropuccinia psidii MF-1]|uniref:Uncharacterized protein n=1 Tax=Austropuccinia psidii MF-1 TaxID=1389203 RepID=A0A9Q3E4G9_9BASI|nr:hypothetical protein [Austropuccinia psidii MF-1]
MTSIDGKEKHDAFKSRVEEKKPSTTQTSLKTSPNSQKQKSQHEKSFKDSEQGQSKGTSHKTMQPVLQNPKYSAGFNGKCVSDGQNHDGMKEKRRKPDLNIRNYPWNFQ